MINAEDRIADLLTRYPALKDKLIKRNKKFKNLSNPVVFNTVGKYARISDVARVSGENLGELLEFINREIEAGD
jgi:NitT/TauT family transport system substrate-binding protein